MPKSLDLSIDILLENETILEDTVKNFLIEKLKGLSNDLLEGIEQCESPIEKLMLIQFNTNPLENTLYRKLYDRFDIFVVMPQIEVKISEEKRYRVDFLITAHNQDGFNFNFVIECDGYEYHSDKEAFQRDKTRDRDLLANGYIPIHFTGSEILNDPEKCVCQVYSTILKHIENRHRY